MTGHLAGALGMKGGKGVKGPLAGGGKYGKDGKVFANATEIPSAPGPAGLDPSKIAAVCEAVNLRNDAYTKFQPRNSNGLLPIIAALPPGAIIALKGEEQWCVWEVCGAGGKLCR